MLAIIERGGKPQEGDGSYSSVDVGLAWNVFQLMVSGAAKLRQQLTSAEAADAYLAEVMEKGDGNPALDVLWEFRASFDYDPAPHLTQIATALLNVNFGDDEINAPSFSSSRALFTSLPNGRLVIVDAGEDALGHQTLSEAKVWQSYVSELLAATR